MRQANKTKKAVYWDEKEENEKETPRCEEKPPGWKTNIFIVPCAFTRFLLVNVCMRVKCTRICKYASVVQSRII